MSDYDYIAAKSIWDYTPESFADHLMAIQAHTRLMQKVKKERSAEKRKAYAKAKPPAKPWSFRVNSKGTAVITIRNRKPKYLLKEEVADMVKENPLHEKLIYERIAEKKIEIKDSEG